jgi:hypothetical protein
MNPRLIVIELEILGIRLAPINIRYSPVFRNHLFPPSLLSGKKNTPGQSDRIGYKNAGETRSGRKTLPISQIPRYDATKRLNGGEI